MAGLLKTLVIMALVALSLGLTSAEPVHRPILVAKASTLNPGPYVPPEPPAVVETRVIQAPAGSTPIAASEGGRSGYLLRGGNCVVCVKAMTGRSQGGNAGTWRPTSSVPWIGAIMIFRPGEQGASGAGHVGVVVGIHGNKISVAHCNWGGGQTEFYSTGKFF